MKYANIEWNNGQPYSADYGDVYYSSHGGAAETEYVFLRQNNLVARWRQAGQFIIGETGFGTGLNFIVTRRHWLATAPDSARLHYFSVEKHPLSPSDLQRVSAMQPGLRTCYDELIACYPLAMPGLHVLDFDGGRVRLYLYFGDIVRMLEQMSCKVDAWYLDGFAPAKNPAMWSDEVFTLLGRRSRAGATFSTYTVSGVVRRGLANAGFTVGKSPGFGSKRDMLKGGIFEQRCFTVDQPWFSPPAMEPDDRPENRVDSRTVLIIGAGLAGLSTAWRLVRRGVRVRLLDRHARVAAGASGNPAGLVLPRLSRQSNAEARFYQTALLQAARTLDELQRGDSRRFWFDSGNLLFGDAGHFQAMCDLHQYPSDYAEVLPAMDANAAAGLAIDRPALYLKPGGWLLPEVLCEVLVAACGERLDLQQADVRDIRYEQRQWRLLDADGNEIASAENLVLANGADCADFSPVSWLPLASTRGQLTVLPASETSRLLKCGISFEHYVTPALDGRHVTGASYEPDSTETELDAAAQAGNIAKLDAFLPGIFDAPEGLCGRTAFRAVSQDRAPLAGAVPDVDAFSRDYADLHHGRQRKLYPPATHLPGLYISSGHGSRGLVSCFVCADVVAAMITAEPLPLEKDLLDYLNPARFPVRWLKRSRPR
jgi:tRNA 5-methylaminomethyl-2-thiouridine biosynthesis bifunctional protein